MHRALILAALWTAPIAAEPLARGPASRAERPAPAEVVHIKTSDGQTLEASYRKPEKPQSPAVVLVHDAGADRRQLDPIGERLHKAGFGVLEVDLRGHGGSKAGKLDWNQHSPEEQKAAWAFGIHDVDAAADWLLEQPNVQKTNLSLVGYGSGCALIARHAKNDENVRCMALLAPKPEDYGFDVRSDIKTLEGLPTYVVAANKNDETERMVQEANSNAGGDPYITIWFSAPKIPTPIEDKNMPKKVATWITEVATPKKGRG